MAKKYFQKAVSMGLSLALCLSLAAPAFAADDSVPGSVLTPPTQTDVEQPPIKDVETDLGKDADQQKDKVDDENVKDAIEKANEAAVEGPAAIEDANGKITGIENAADTKIEEIQNAANEKLEQPTQDYAEAEKKANEAVNNAEEKQAEVTKAQEQVDAENPTVDQYKAVADAALEAANARTEAAEAIQAQVDSAQAVADAAASAYEAAQKEYAELLKQVNDDLDAIGDKEALLKEAKAKLDAADADLQTAKGTLDGLTASLNDAWDEVKTAQGSLATAVADYLTAQGTVKTAEGVIKTITNAYGSKLGAISEAELKEKVDAVLAAKRVKDSADTANTQAGTVKTTLDNLNAVKTAVDGYAEDKEEIKEIGTSIQNAEKAIDDGKGGGARPEAQQAFEKQWNVHDADTWLEARKYAEKVQLGTEYKKEITGDDIAKWIKEDPQPNDPNYVARHEWMAGEGKDAVDRFLNELTDPDVKGPAGIADARKDLKEYLNSLGAALKKMQTAEKNLATETAKLDSYKTTYGETFTTAQALQDELDRLTTVEYGKVEAADAIAFGVKLGEAQQQLKDLVRTYNGLVGEDQKLNPETATIEQLTAKLANLVPSAANSLTSALNELNTKVGSGSKYTDAEAAELSRQMTELQNKWKDVDNEKVKITNAKLSERQTAMETAGSELNTKKEAYGTAHDETQKAHSDYLAAQALVAEVKGELEKLQGPNSPKNFDTLTQEKLNALKAELDAAEQQLQNAKDRHEEAKKAEEEAKKAAEDAQKVYDDAVEEARRALEEAIGDDTGITIDDEAVPLAAGPVTCAQFVDYLWRHEGSPEAEGELFTDHEYAPAIAWALSTGLIDEAFQPDELVTVADVRAILGNFARVFGTNAVAADELTTLTGGDGEAVLNCDEVLAEFFGEAYVRPEDLDNLEVDDAA